MTCPPATRARRWLYDWWSGSTNGSPEPRARSSPSGLTRRLCQAAAGCSDRPDPAEGRAAARSSGMPIHLLNFWGASGFEKW